MTTKLTTLLATAACALVLSSGMAHAEIKVSEPYTFETAPEMKVGGAFMEIENTGDKAEHITKATSSVCDHVEIHSMDLDENGVMKMRELKEGIEIPAGQKVELAPQGLHIMLIGLKEPLAAGKSIDLTLERGEGEPVKVDVLVKSRMPMEKMGKMGQMGQPENMMGGEHMEHGNMEHMDMEHMDHDK